MKSKIIKKIFTFSMIFILVFSFSFVSVSADGDSINIADYKYPLTGSSTTVSSPYGWRTLSGETKFHAGIDLVAKTGDSVVAWKNGTVYASYYDSSWGNYIILYHGMYKGKSIYTGYAHLSERKVSVNTVVKKGQLIGKAGNTGESYGSHLHFEVYYGGCNAAKPPKDYTPDRINPAPYIGLKNAKGTYKVTNESFVDVPTKPTLSLTPTSNKSVLLKWGAETARSYELQRKESGGNWSTIKTTSSKSINTSLKVGVTYSYRVRSICDDEKSDYSSTVSFRPLTKVKNFNAKLIGYNSAKLNWSSVAYAKKYYVYRKYKGGSWKRIAEPTETSYTAKNFYSGKTIYLCVKANNGKAFGETSDGDKIGTISKTKITSITAKNNTNITLNYKKATNATSYNIYRKTTTNGTYKRLATTKNNSYSTTVPVGKKYYYAVKSAYGSNSSIETAFSNAKSFQSIGTPIIKSCILTTTTSAKIVWEKLDGVSGYRVYRSVANSNYTLYKNKYKATSLSESKLITGKTYRYKIVGYRGSITGPESKVAKAEVLGVPEITSLELSASSTAKLTWKRTNGAYNYVIYRKVNSTGKYTLLKTVSSSVLSITDNTLQENNTYYYLVKATQNNIKSSVSNVLKIKMISGISTLSSSERSNNDISISWTSVAGAKGYYLYRKTNSGNWVKIKSFASGIKTYTDEDIVQGNIYTYLVKAFSGVVTTKASNTIIFKPLAIPIITKAEFETLATLNVEWNSVKNIDGYELYEEVNDENWKKVTLSSLKALEYKENINVANSYSFRIRAYATINNKNYYSEYSKISKVKYNENIEAPIPSLNIKVNDGIAYIVSDMVNDMFEYTFEYKNGKSGTYKVISSGYENSCEISGLENNAVYYFRANMSTMLDTGKKIKGKYSSEVSMTPRAHYEVGKYTDLVDLEAMFDCSCLVSSESLLFDYNIIYNKNSDFFMKYCDAMIDTGATCSLSNKNTQAIFKINGNTFTMKIEGSLLKIY